MALLEYIKDQLLFKDTVTLPGLGSFEIKKNPSRIHGKKITPPTVQIVFNPDRSLDDGSLASSIAGAEEINPEEAKQKVLEYIDEILFALNKGENYSFEGFGILSRDSENVFHFDKDPTYQIEFESYGLESFELDPLDDSLSEGTSVDKKRITETERKHTESTGATVITTDLESADHNNPDDTEEFIEQESEKSPTKEGKNNRNILWILTGALVVILISFIVIKMSTTLLDGNSLSVFSSGSSDKPGTNPEDENWDVDSKLNGELGEAIDSMTMQENALTIEETSEPLNKVIPTEPAYNEFHIIAGSFKDKVNAGILQQELTSKGYPALVIKQGEQLYRVSAISFKDKDQGLQELSRFKQKNRNNAAWLLKLE